MPATFRAGIEKFRREASDKMKAAETLSRRFGGFPRPFNTLGKDYRKISSTPFLGRCSGFSAGCPTAGMATTGMASGI
ncbi:hypothetical protein SAMN06295888_11818 [Desulfonatronum zhilinae]|nr:hypothetical protein SAMN06295888_11818 [Desulfonatronum zhilinae]